MYILYIQFIYIYIYTYIHIYIYIYYTYIYIYKRDIGKLQEDQEGQGIGHQVHVEVMERSAGTKALKAMNSGRNYPLVN